MTTRRSPRLLRSTKAVDDEIVSSPPHGSAADSPRLSATAKALPMTPGEDPKQHQPSEHDEEEEESDEEQREGAVSIGQLVASYVFEGRLYESYQDMVDAKRKRNQQVLMDSGLLDLAEEVRRTHQRRRVTVTPGGGGGLSSRKQKHRPSADSSSPEGRRKSNRLAGIRSDGRYVEDERAGRFSFATAAATSAYVSSAHDGGTEQGPSNETVGVDVEFYRGRINDGSSLSIRDAVEKVDDRWLEETSAADAERFVREEIGSVSAVESMTRTLSSSLSPPSLPSTPRSKGKASSKGNATVSSSSSLSQAVLEQIRKLHIDNENWVSKVTPDRIYGIAIHPRSDLLVVCAGDKAGHVGIWKIPDLSDGTDASNGVIKNGDNDEAVATRSSHHLFRLHRGAASCLQWTPSGSKLYSASYDGTVRCLDAQRESFEQVFATYDDSVEFQTLLGHGMDTGRHYWTQYACLDTRFGGGSAENCLFVSTSVGTAMHLDLRAGSGRGKVTFHEELSEKKINTLSLHPNGHTLVSAGLDCTVKIWDLRKFQDSRTAGGYKSPAPLGVYSSTKSVNSAFLSPSGRYCVCTTMANRLDLLENVHLATNAKATATFKAAKRIVHDNMTGRWLSTFMAQWHPSLDVFCVGSMLKPRCVQVFDSAGNCLREAAGSAMTAVASRCCFHPSETHITIAGGNSSGRVTVVR